MVSFGMTLEAELTDYDEGDTKARLARLYNVSVDAISLSVEAGSLKLRVAIVPADRSEGGVAALAGAIESKEIMAEMSTVLGSHATVTLPPVNTEEAVEEYEATCPLGHWCSVGLEIPCGENTYNDETQPKQPGRVQAVSDGLGLARGFYIHRGVRLQARLLRRGGRNAKGPVRSVRDRQLVL